jgi:hypothetical protein
MPTPASQHQSEIEWPTHWECAAIEAVLPYLGSDERLRIVLGDPKKSIHGTVIGGHLYVEDGTPMIVHDRSGRPDVFPWQLLRGPVLRIELIRPRRRPLVLYAHPGWKPPHE